VDGQLAAEATLMCKMVDRVPALPPTWKYPEMSASQVTSSDRRGKRESRCRRSRWALSGDWRARRAGEGSCCTRTLCAGPSKIDATTVSSVLLVGGDPPDFRFQVKKRRSKLATENTFREYVTITGARWRRREDYDWRWNFLLGFVACGARLSLWAVTVVCDGATLAGHVTWRTSPQSGSVSGASILPRRRYAYIGLPR